MEVFVARQPIFDRHLKVHGYELLFRSSYENAYDCPDGDRATSTVIANSFLLIGIDALVGKKRAFINFTKNLIRNETATLLPKEIVSVEILEDVPADPETLMACRYLKQLGYTLVMDDFVFREDLVPLIELADIIKIDFINTSPADRREWIRRFGSRNLRFLAEKVETRTDFDEALELGYSFFQGYFFSKPVIISGSDVPGYKVNYLRILREINHPALDFDRIENLIKQDVSLTYKLLKFINSAAFGFRTRIRSVRQALVLLGLREVIKWVSLITLRGLGMDQPDELIITTVVRARFAELLAPLAGFPDQGPEMFLMGLFSMLDVFIGKPMAEALNDLPISEEIKNALLGRAGRYTELLTLVLAYEKGDWEETIRMAGRLNVREDDLPVLYRNAVEQSNSFVSAGISRV